MSKDKEFHTRLNQDQFAKMAKKCIDLQITRTHFIERAIDFYLDLLEDKLEISKRVITINGARGKVKIGE